VIGALIIGGGKTSTERMGNIIIPYHIHGQVMNYITLDTIRLLCHELCFVSRIM
jgi:hypothetical protein